MTRKRVFYKSDKPSKTQQAPKDDCDVNKILKKYEKTGMVLHQNHSQGSYGDFTNYGDFRSGLEIITNAQNAFDALPSKIRKKFGNNPALLLEFIQDPSNIDEAIKLGLAKKPVPAPINDDKTTTQEPNAQA